MDMEDIDAVIFDFGGVLININYQDTIDSFNELGIDDFESLYSQASQSNLFNDYETGVISSQDFIKGVLSHLPSGVTPEQVINAWNDMIKNVPAEVIKLLIKLRKVDNKKVYMLSNTNAIHIELAYKLWQQVSDDMPDTIFNHVYLSHEVKDRKPNASIFERVCEEQNLNPARTLFIDDSIQHIEGAQSVGLRTFHLKNQEDLYTLFS